MYLGANHHPLRTNQKSSHSHKNAYTFGETNSECRAALPDEIKFSFDSAELVGLLSNWNRLHLF